MSNSYNYLERGEAEVGGEMKGTRSYQAKRGNDRIACTLLLQGHICSLHSLTRAECGMESVGSVPVLLSNCTSQTSCSI